MNKLSDLFKKKPEKWGLRGDPYLWEELEKLFSEIEMPELEEKLKAIYEESFEKLTGYSIYHPENFFVEKQHCRP